MSGTQQTKEIFSDIQSVFDIHPIRKDIGKVSNEASIKQSIYNLLKTNKYERLYQPRIGSNINALLFENVSPLTQYALKESIESTIRNFEPRIETINAVVTPDPDSNLYSVTVIFSVINISKEITFDFVLERIR